MKIALTGVTGKLGGKAADILKGKNLDLRYLARRPERVLGRRAASLEGYPVLPEAEASGPDGGRKTV